MSSITFPADAGPATDPAADPFALKALRTVFFTGFAIVSTVLGYVFLPPAGAALALLFAWKGADALIDPRETDFALRSLTVVAVTAFATVATVMGFVFLPPAGLVLAAIFVWRGMASFGRTPAAADRPATGGPCPTGNTAFDAYRDDTMRRLEDERVRFESFLSRLRDAKDKAEFDRFIGERAQTAPSPRDEGDAPA